MNYFAKCNISFEYEMVYIVRGSIAKNSYGTYCKGGQLNFKKSYDTCINFDGALIQGKLPPSPLSTGLVTWVL